MKYTAVVRIGVLFLAGAAPQASAQEPPSNSIATRRGSSSPPRPLNGHIYRR